MQNFSHPRPMTIAIAHQYGGSLSARILCIGDRVERLLEIQRQLDDDQDFVIVGCPTEGHAALATEGPFDVIITDRRMREGRSALFLARLRQHSPDAERLVLADSSNGEKRRTAASEGRVMWLLPNPCPALLLREAVADAMLRHRARYMRTTMEARVTPRDNPAMKLG